MRSPSAQSADNERPTFSVVIVVHEDSRLISEAFRSLRNQKFDLRRLEIFVVRPAEVSLPREIEEGCARILTVNDPDYGPKLAAALSRCRGELVLPLEYDDEWEPSRLMTIERELEEVPSLGFYGNSVTLIDQRGDRFPTSNGPEPFTPRTHWFRGAGLDMLTLRRFISPISYHGSAIALRRQMLIPHAGEIRRVHLSIAAFSLFLALNTDVTIGVDPRRLTLYRLHDQNTSLPRSNETRFRLIQRSIEDFQVIRDLLGKVVDPVGLELVREKIQALESAARALAGSSAR